MVAKRKERSITMSPSEAELYVLQAFEERSKLRNEVAKLNQEIDRLRDLNAGLSLKVLDLKDEVAVLKSALVRAEELSQSAREVRYMFKGR